MSAARALDWHEAFGWALIVVNTLAGAWALAAYQFRKLRGRPLWIAVIVGQLLGVRPGDHSASCSRRKYDYELNDMHALYGFSAIIAVGILYSYRTSPFMKGKELLLYGFGCLFIMGLGLRNLVL